MDVRFNVSKGTTILFTTPVGASPSPDQHRFSVWQSIGAIHPVICVKLDTRLTSLPHIDQVKKKAAPRLGVLGSFQNTWSSAV